MRSGFSSRLLSHLDHLLRARGGRFVMSRSNLLRLSSKGPHLATSRSPRQVTSAGFGLILRPLGLPSALWSLVLALTLTLLPFQLKAAWSAAETPEIRLIRDSRLDHFSSTNRRPAPHHITFVNRSKLGRFGAAVGSAGDLDGDGIDDCLIADPRFNSPEPDVGQVYLVKGSPSNAAPPLVIALRGVRRGATFGASLSGGVDLNGDGLPDCLVGAPRLKTEGPFGSGVYLLAGSRLGDSAPTFLPLRAPSQAGFGRSISGSADINGDGVLDLLVGAPEADHGSGGEGAAMLFLGPLRAPHPSPSWVVYGTQSQGGFGFRVLCAKDLSGDGIGDIVIAAPQTGDQVKGAGRVSVFFGSTQPMSEHPDWVWEGEYPREGLGRSMACADLNRDGVDDLLLGAPGNGEREGVSGRVIAFLGPLNASKKRPDWESSGAHEASGFGHQVAVVGDMNGDGHAEVAVSAPYANGRERGVGRVYLFAGQASGVPGRSMATLDGAHARARFGWTIASGGDADGDGLRDVLIGSPYHLGEGGDVGRADLIFGSLTAFQPSAVLVARRGASEVVLPAPESSLRLSDPSLLRGRGRWLSAGWLPLLLAASLLLGGAWLFLSWKKQEELRRRLAVDAERARIARDLHDNLGPELTRLALLERPDAKSELAEGASSASQRAIESMSELVWRTNPRNDRLDQFLDYLGEYAARLAQAADLSLDLVLPVSVPALQIPAGLRMELMSVVKEALNNAVKHADARSIRMRVSVIGTRLSVEVADDGKGFSSTSLRAQGNGLRNMGERMGALGGTFGIESAPGQGTKICIEVSMADQT
jgi:signal transduction histidine kinase